ncbi:hepatic sodium/bile acid cotransporter-like [Centruroides vittatus]|uniref:hepatic sodium/bile acid cotransporter-like n=1 Tax=Centruroides vittatus TaxID=120091 RepID=UPI00350F8451
MALSLVMITSPALVGMIIRWKFPRASVYLTKWGSALGLGTFLLTFVLELISFQRIIHELTFILVLTTVLMPLTGVVMGYLLSFLFRRNQAICTTIAIESGIQNVPVAISVISLSFDTVKNISLVLVPWFYLVSQVAICCALCLFYHIIMPTLKQKCSPMTPIFFDRKTKYTKPGSKEETTA